MSPRPTSRRAFLSGQSATPAPGDELDNPVDSGGSSNSPAETFLLRVGRRAMACQFEVLLNAGQYADGTELAVAALDLVDRLEAQLSVYRDQSEVSRLNAAAFEREFEVEPRLFELLQLATAIHSRSQGAYDITSGPLSKVWGFYRRAGHLPEESDLAAARGRVGSDRMVFNAERLARSAFKRLAWKSIWEASEKDMRLRPRSRTAGSIRRWRFLVSRRAEQPAGPRIAATCGRRRLVGRAAASTTARRAAGGSPAAESGVGNFRLRHAVFLP